jgi:hypothetical protein
MRTFTKGSWRANFPKVVTDAGLVICEVRHAGAHNSNEYLIAAAPDLLAATEEALGFIEHALEFFNWSAFPSLQGSVEKTRDKMRAVIAEVRGTS